MIRREEINHDSCGACHTGRKIRQNGREPLPTKIYESKVSFFILFFHVYTNQPLGRGFLRTRKRHIERKISNFEKKNDYQTLDRIPGSSKRFWASFFNVIEKRDQLYGVEVGQVRVGVRVNVTSMNARPSYPIMST